MNGGLEFTLFGIPVRVLWMFFFVMFLFGSSWQEPVLIALWVGIAFGSILAHEMGHALVYRSFGVRPSVVLHGFGGLTFGRSLPVAKDLAVSVAGPFVGLLIGLPLLYVYNRVPIHDPTLRTAVYMGVFINVFWSLINLLPLMPLDGGNALNALLSLVLRRDMTQVTRVLSILTAGVAIGVALKYQFIFGALLAGYYLYMNVQALRQGPRVGRFAPKVTMPPSGPSTPAGQAPPSAPQSPSAPGSGPSSGLGPTSGPGPAFGPGPTSGATGQGAPPGPQTWPPVPPAQPPTRDAAQASPGPAAAAPGAGAVEQPPWVSPRSGSGRRTFGQEVESTAQALARNEPELASIAVDRAARLVASPEDAIVVQQLRDEVMRRLASG